MYIFNFEEFISEGVLLDTSRKIEVKFRIEADDHFYDGISRFDNEPDEDGNTIIDEDEVLKDIDVAINQIATRNLFNIGLYWDKSTNKLNKDILIVNSKTKLNIILIISKDKNKYLFKIKTVMRKSGFISSSKEKTEIIYI